MESRMEARRLPCWERLRVCPKRLMRKRTKAAHARDVHTRCTPMSKERMKEDKSSERDDEDR